MLKQLECAIRIRVPKELKVQISEAAVQDESSMSVVIRKAIKQYLEGEDGKSSREHSNTRTPN